MSQNVTELVLNSTVVVAEVEVSHFYLCDDDGRVQHE